MYTTLCTIHSIHPPTPQHNYSHNYNSNSNSTTPQLHNSTAPQLQYTISHSTFSHMTCSYLHHKVSVCPRTHVLDIGKKLDLLFRRNLSQTMQSRHLLFSHPPKKFRQTRAASRLPGSSEQGDSKKYI